MKKLILSLLIGLGVLSFCGCPAPIPPVEEFYSKSFVTCYDRPADYIYIEQRTNRYSFYISFDYNPDKYINPATTIFLPNCIYANSTGADKVMFDMLCEKHNDLTYNRIVMGYSHSMSARDYINFEIWSSADWDEAHTAGDLLGDIVRFESNTPYPYIQSGYTQKYLYDNGRESEYYPINCLVSELTPDNMILLDGTGFRLYFTPPTLSQQHTIYLRLIADDGTVLEADIDVDFSK